jgi:cyclophilin family peptidyl-prolyl cis-trans isomerase
MWQRIFPNSRRSVRQSRQRRSRKTRLSKLASFESLESRALLTATPMGGEFLISDNFQPTQRIVPEVSSVAIADSGESVVVYHGRGVSGARLAGDDREIFFQRFDADGAEVGDPIVANAITRGDQFDPSADAAADGTFWIVWSGRGEGDRHGVFAQRFANDGSTIGETLRVNSTVGGAQMRPDVATADDGSAVVVWSGVGTGDGASDFDGVFMRRIDASGDLVGVETRVNSTIVGQQDHPAVAMNDSGDFVVTWNSRNEDGDDWGVFAQQFNADGTTKGAQIAVNSTIVGSQFAADVGSADDNSFVVTWSSFAQDGDSWGVFAQQFSSGGARVGDEIQINGESASHQQDAAIAVSDGGEFLIAWSHGEPDGSGWETHGRSFNRDGDPAEDAFEVNQDTNGVDSGHQRLPAVDMNSTGESMIVFHGNGAADHHGVFGQRYVVDVGPVENVDPVIISVDGETVLSNINIDGNVGETVRIRIVAEDDNRNDTLTFRLSDVLGEAPDDAVIDPIDNNMADVVWTPSIDDLGASVPFRVIVEDDGVPIGDEAVQFFVNVKNEAPVVDLNGPNDSGNGFQAFLEMIETQVAAVDTDLTVTDAEHALLAGATAELTGVTDQMVESLSVDVLGTSITATYDAPSSVLSLTGEDTIDNYQQVLRTLVYENRASDRTVGGNRQINIRVSDGVDESDVVTSRITLVGENAAPTLEEIENVTLLSGSPLHIPLLGSDAEGDPLTFAATSDNAMVSTLIPTGNRSARITVSSPTNPAFVGGDMVFELFEHRADRATDRIIALAEDDFYDGIIFHRVVDGFVIQGGDPTGTGMGGSTLGDFDDQFHPDLQHNRTGVLSMAKSRDDTNDSQFFITEVPTRALDSQHTIFGQLITGDEVREEVSNVPTLGSRPSDDVVIENFEIFVDDENGILMLSAPDGFTGSATITVTANDGRGGTAVRMFDVTVIEDTNDNQPFLDDIPRLEMDTNATAVFQLSALDLENDDILFLDQDQLRSEELLQPITSSDLTYFVDPLNGELTVVATGDLTGTHRFTVGVIQADQLGLANRAIDLQVVEIVIDGTSSPS